MHSKSRSLFPWLLATAALMAGALSLWKLWPSADAPATKQVDSAPATRSLRAAPRAPAPSRAGDERWRLGSRRTYALELTSQPDTAGASGGPWTAITLRGNLNVAIAQVEPAIVLRADLADAAERDARSDRRAFGHRLYRRRRALSIRACLVLGNQDGRAGI